jgi:hypothetical protein
MVRATASESTRDGTSYRYSDSMLAILSSIPDARSASVLSPRVRWPAVGVSGFLRIGARARIAHDSHCRIRARPALVAAGGGRRLRRRRVPRPVSPVRAAVPAAMAANCSPSTEPASGQSTKRIATSPAVRCASSSVADERLDDYLARLDASGARPAGRARKISPRRSKPCDLQDFRNAQEPLLLQGFSGA